MDEGALYKELGALTRHKEKWEESIPFVASLLRSGSDKIRAKALWLLGEMGLKHPSAIQTEVRAIIPLFDSESPLLRGRAVNAVGRIGRGDYHLIEPYWPAMFRFASDRDAGVRLSFIWASENIATNTPEIYVSHMAVFASLLHDTDTRVRMEAPEIFRVLGKRRPAFVLPFIDALRKLSESDENSVVRVHALGAIRATVNAQNAR